MSLRRLSAQVSLGLGAALFAVAGLLLLFGGLILNSYGKGQAERAFAKAHPGCSLRLGHLDYALIANRLVAQSLTLSTPKTTLKIDRLCLTGTRWARLLWRKAALTNALAKASLDATNLEAEFPDARYAIHCAGLWASVPGSALIAEGAELRPLVTDEEIFAAHTFRSTRYHVVVPECRVLGLAFGELLQGQAYRAGAVYVSGPSFDALVNRDKPVNPFEKPLMVHEALASIRQPLQVDSLSITNGRIRYAERVLAGADPGVLTFGAVSFTVHGLANRGEPGAAIQLRAQGDLMNAATLRVLMSIPIAPPSFSFHYSGSLTAMDLTRLNGFLEIAERTRVKSGSAQAVSFEVDVAAGQAHGYVHARYRHLEVAVLDKETDTAKGIANRVASFFTNLEIRKANPEPLGSLKEGKVNYTRKPDDEFVQYAWFALRAGVMDVISR